MISYEVYIIDCATIDDDKFVRTDRNELFNTKQPQFFCRSYTGINPPATKRRHPRARPVSVIVTIILFNAIMINTYYIYAYMLVYRYPADIEGELYIKVTIKILKKIHSH